MSKFKNFIKGGMSESPIDQDKTCQEGFYCPPSSESPNQVQCPAGNECPDTSPVPIPCPDGKYADLPGQSECEICPGGSYCMVDKSDGNGVITPQGCPAGYYCPELDTGLKRPIACPIGTYSTTLKNQDADDCEICPEGYVCTGLLNKTIKNNL